VGTSKSLLLSKNIPQSAVVGSGQERATANEASGSHHDHVRAEWTRHRSNSGRETEDRIGYSGRAGVGKAAACCR
jgi:hypothetical protein